MIKMGAYSDYKNRKDPAGANIRKGLKVCGNCNHVKFGPHDWCNKHECYIDIYKLECTLFKWAPGTKKIFWPGILLGCSIILFIIILFMGGEPF